MAVARDNLEEQKIIMLKSVYMRQKKNKNFLYKMATIDQQYWSPKIPKTGKEFLNVLYFN